MKPNAFITPALSGWLDLVRALAACAVVVGHAHQIGIYTGYYPFSMALQLNAVVVFFVLSGLVIAQSAARQGASAGHYAAARIARILPVAWPALALSYLAAVYCASRGFSPEPVAQDPGVISIGKTLMAGLFIDEGYGGGLAINPPFWSLAYEVWFYVLFAIALWMKGIKRVVAMLFACLAAGPNVLLLLPVWLCGVALVHIPRFSSHRMTPLASLIAIQIAIAALYCSTILHVNLSEFIKPLTFIPLGHSHHAISYMVLGILIALALAGARSLLGETGKLPQKLLPPVRWLADMSFSLYLMHWPILTVIKASGISAGDSAVGFAAILTAVVALCGLFARYTEHRREPLRRWLEKRFKGGERELSATGQRISTSSSAIEGCNATV